MISASYRVRVLPAERQLEVELDLRGLAPGAPLRLQVPSWVPGAYGFMKYGRDLFDVRAFGPDGEELPLIREGWQGFALAKAPSAVTVRYRALASDPAWGELAGVVDQDHAVLLGTRYLFAKEATGPLRVQYQVPEGWPLHHPSGARDLGGGAFEYPGHAALLDTPVVLGNFKCISRELRGAKFHHLFVDRAVGFDSEVEGFVDQVMRVAESCHALFGSFPFADYSFVYSFSPAAHWGLEHACATMIGVGEDALIDPKQRASAMRVAAHELLHAWNVCRMRPAALLAPDLAAGSFTDALWVAEGITRYYEFLLCVRSGALAVEAFFSNLVNYHRHLQALPAYERVSVTDSSLATFLNHNRYPGSVNATIDYYDKGMLIAFDLDALLRAQRPAATLDGELRALYAAFVGPGFTHAKVKAFLSGRTPAAGDLLTREAERPGGLTTPEQLTRLGFELREAKVPYAGIVLLENKGPLVANVLDDSPAGASGLSAGDELVKLDGLPFSLKALKWLIARGAPFTAEAKRGGRYLGCHLSPRTRTDITGLTWRGSPAQLEAWRAWLGRPEWSPTSGQELPLTSYENFHGVQTVL
ncbi:MAG: M61 family metallopeptidase [Myxococcaceae bacterium]